jgi:surface antigen
MGRFMTDAGTLLTIIAILPLAPLQTSPVPNGAYRGTPAMMVAAAFGAEPRGLTREVVGGTVEEGDRRMAAEAVQRALNGASDGTTVSWNNPANGHQGSIAPMHTYQALGGGQCREYETATTIEGRPSQDRGVACRGGDGTWKLLPSQ